MKTEIYAILESKSGKTWTEDIFVRRKITLVEARKIMESWIRKYYAKGTLVCKIWISYEGETEYE